MHHLRRDAEETNPIPQQTPRSPQVQRILTGHAQSPIRTGHGQCTIRTGHSESPIRTRHSQSPSLRPGLRPIPMLDLDLELRGCTQTHTVDYRDDELTTDELYEPMIDLDFKVIAETDNTK